MQPRLQPWRSFSEWCNVYNLLYSTMRDSQMRGLEMAAMWSARVPRLPLSVECTVQLLQAQHEGSVSGYSLAVVRFVNGMVDQAQKGVYARPVTHIAGELGIPEWIVDLRHSATHKTMPVLSNLKQACSVALQWLNDKYWQPQVKHHSNRVEFVTRNIDLYLAAQSTLDAQILENKKQNKYDRTLITERLTSLISSETELLVSAIVSHAERVRFSVAWVYLLEQINKIKPELLAVVFYRFCSKIANLNVFSWMNAVFEHHLFNEGCQDNHALYIHIICKHSLNQDSIELCSKIIQTSISKLNKKTLILSELFQSATTSPAPQSKPTSTIVLELESIIDKIICAPPSGRFLKCNSELWDHIPLGCLPSNLEPELSIECLDRKGEERCQSMFESGEGEKIEEVGIEIMEVCCTETFVLNKVSLLDIQKEIEIY